MKQNLFRVFRIVTFVGLVVLLASRISRAPAPKLICFFLTLVLLWFVPSILWSLVRSRAGRPLLHGRDVAVFSAVDGYLLLMAAAAALVGVWHRPVLLLGAYVFFAGLLGGPLAGATAAGATFFGLLNGWLLPIGDLRGGTLLLGGGTALAALACSMAWWWSLPMLVRMVRVAVVGEEQAKSLDEPIANQIAALELRLRSVSAERDQAQEQLNEWDAKQAARATAASSSDPKDASVSPGATSAVPVTSDPALQARLNEVAAALADSRAERAALLAEKQKLLAEIADLDKELSAVQASVAANTPEPTPTPTPAKPEEGTHANG